MDLLDKYFNFRETLLRLHSKILDECVNADDFNKSVEILDIVKNNEVILESQSEEELLLDFNVYENLRNGENAIFEYMKKDIENTEQEKLLLNAMSESEHSLYKIIDIQREKCIITLEDMLKNKDPVKVVDRGLSNTTNKNILIYTRLLDLGEFNITSGMGFTFSLDHKDYLIKRSRKLMKKVKHDNSSVSRFIAFFKLNRTDGLPMASERFN